MWFKPLSESRTQFEIYVVAKPNARTSQLLGLDANKSALKVAIAAQPVEGKANTELLRFFSELLGIPKSHIEIFKGENSKLKRLRVTIAEEVLTNLKIPEK